MRVNLYSMYLKKKKPLWDSSSFLNFSSQSCFEKVQSLKRTPIINTEKVKTKVNCTLIQNSKFILKHFYVISH